ncbi:CoA transferase [Bradyrhizobium sp. Leo170]|uniref:CaiB/BaiF CoA transferase family protein n=1 Tax=Bradyrhizobium sp. Leo170 TaxID=1571199 RepID=UPI00102E26DE|nr:CoA transferase [Bradyrhizobium sp. Leo170]TAI62977.1 CoA transferase [Bradyrhizobium sp. Leo170]
MKPLQGVRIVSVEQFGAGPYATMLLADLGAEVIKIENAAIGGDPSRKTGPFMLGTNDSEYFQAFNINKKSVAIDLRSEEGRAALRELAAGADALLNNLRGDLPSKLGLNYSSLAAVNPSIVCVHLSAYGRDNDRASWPGYDYLMQAEAGLMHLTGEPDGPPSRLGAPSIIDQTTGLTAAVGLLSAVIQARSSGKGCDVDTCLLDVALHQLGYVATWYLNESHISSRQPRSAHYSVAPVQTFPTSDGWLFIMCMTDKFWGELIKAIERKDLASDPRFATQALRQANRDELTSIIDADMRRHSTSYWLGKLNGVLPVAPVLDLAQALDNPFLQTSGMINAISHPAKPNMRVLANPIKINGQRPSQAACSPYGADNPTYVGKARSTAPVRSP